MSGDGRRRFAGAVLAMALILPAISAGATGGDGRTVVLLLFDGWAPAMLPFARTPVLERMRHEGAWTHRFLPSFPSISLSSQFSITTGCWPAHHGIVANKFLDPARGLYDHSPDADWLTGCELLHETAERQGVRAASLWWVGSRSSARGPLATYVAPASLPNPGDLERAQEVARLLRLPDDERPRLILSYFRGPDDTAHFTGMESDATRAAVEGSDRAVGVVLAAIDALPFRDHVTLIVTTDHGMVPVTTIVNVGRILRNHGIAAQVAAAGTTACRRAAR